MCGQKNNIIKVKFVFLFEWKNFCTERIKNFFRLIIFEFINKIFFFILYNVRIIIILT